MTIIPKELRLKKRKLLKRVKTPEIFQKSFGQFKLISYICITKEIIKVIND